MNGLSNLRMVSSQQTMSRVWDGPQRHVMTLMLCKFVKLSKYNNALFVYVLFLSNLGAIRNTEPLDYERSHNHILSVVAYDCGMKQSVPVMVTIKVNRICKLGWKGMI
jgi:hypothetical protein